jgi:hypothetical protein
MFLFFENSNYKKTWCAYTLTDCNQRIRHIGVVTFRNLTMLADIPDLPEGQIMLNVIDTDEDRLKLLNRAVQWCEKQNRDDLSRSLCMQKPKETGQPIICNETGERYRSVRECCIRTGNSEQSMYKHLKKMIGYSSLKGLTFTRTVKDNE